MSSVQTYLEKYGELKQRTFPALQERAIQHFSRLGFPTVKNEEWKYTSIAPILARQFTVTFADPGVSREEIIARFPFLRDAICLFTVNGNLVPAISDLSALPAGFAISRLSEGKQDPVIEKYYNRYADVNVDAFAALNTAFCNEGLVIRIQKNSTCEKPVYVIELSSSGQEAVMSHTRLLIIAEANSSACISSIAISRNENSETFVNAVIEAHLEENAAVELDLLQYENGRSYRIAGTYAYQCANSRFSVNTVALGGSILKNKLHIRMDGQNCETHMHGLYIAGESQLIDNHTAVYHAKPHCNSNELYKGIVGGKAHGVFNGKIFVEKDAQKTNAYQSNKNILLSNEAVVNAKPQLEIFADDVKCTHGATTGQMDEEALFYLRSRGINEADAKALLNLAFANDIINNISSEDFRHTVSRLVESKLKSIAS